MPYTDEIVGFAEYEIPLVEFKKVKRGGMPPTTNEEKAKIIELFIGLDTSIKDIAIITGVHHITISTIISRDYFGVKDGRMIKLTSRV